MEIDIPGCRNHLYFACSIILCLVLIRQAPAATAVRSRLDELESNRYTSISKIKRTIYDFHLTGQAMDFTPDYSRQPGYAVSPHKNIQQEAPFVFSPRKVLYHEHKNYAVLNGKPRKLRQKVYARDSGNITQCRRNI